MSYTQSKGEVGYLAYAAFTGGKTHDDRRMPDWRQLPPRIQQAWDAAAAAILASDVASARPR